MNYYLQCGNCGKYNEASSEFLVFCSNCKKKLALNFRDWKRSRTDASIDEFHKEVCILLSGETIVQEFTSAPKVNSSRYLLISAILLVIAFLFFSLFTPYIYKESPMYSYIKKLLGDPQETDWQRYQCGQYGLTVESPVRLNEISRFFPSYNSTSIKDLLAYGSKPDDILSIVVISSRFDEGIGNIDLEASISGLIGNISDLPGISRFRVSQSEYAVSGINGFEQNGSFMQAGQPKAFLCVGVTKGSLLWQVMVIYDVDKDGLAEDARRVIDSIEIHYNNGV